MEKSTIIPHHKIEKLIVESGIPYTFLHPAYFMQNFTTTLLKDLKEKHMIFLPAGNAKFTLVDASDIGRVAAQILINPKKYVNQSFDLTNDEQLTFGEMAEKFSRILNIHIQYVFPNLIRFFFAKRKEKVPTMLILVMIMLHYLPRFQAVTIITSAVKDITGRTPITIEDFILNNKAIFLN